MSNSQNIGTTFTGGLQIPNYFNGRLLAAEDLQADQTADLTRENWLGQAIGYGVVSGLLVRAVGTASVQVTKGRGINAEGQVLQLPSDITLPLVPQPDPAGPSDDAGRFQNCNFGPANTAGAVTRGAYLITVLPASRLEGLAPMKGASSTSVPACASKWETAGLSFKIIKLAGFPDPTTGAPAPNLRNQLAHWCFGSLALQKLAQNPFTFDENFTGLDSVESADLTAGDLPLAVLYWTGSAIAFVDDWSARRRLIRPFALDAWTGLLSDKRVALGQARFLQFQAQLAALSDQANRLTAEEYFPFLPPCGFLPVDARLLLQAINPGERAAPALMQIANSELTRVAGRRLAATMSATSRASALNADLTADPSIRLMRAQMQEMSLQVQHLRAQMLQAETAAAKLKAGAQEAAPQASGAQQPASPAQSGLSGPQQAELALLRRYLEIQAGKSRGVDLLKFFGDLPLRAGVVDRETIDFTLNRSWYDEAIDLQAGLQREERPAIDIYFVADALRNDTGPVYVMFTKRLRPIVWLTPSGKRRPVRSRTTKAPASPGQPVGVVVLAQQPPAGGGNP